MAKFVVRTLSPAHGLGKGIFRGFQEAVRNARALENGLLLLILVSSVAKFVVRTLAQFVRNICMLSSCCKPVGLQKPYL